MSHQVLRSEGTITILEVPKENVQPFILKYTGMVK